MSADPMSVIQSYVEGQASLGYAQWDPGPDPTDVILTTFPKSGSTWSSYLMHQLRSAGDESFEDIKDAVVDITPGHWNPTENPFASVQHYYPRTYKTHGSYALAPKGARYIYIARDPKDSFWSMYHFIHDLFGLEERAPIDVFYRDFFVDRFNCGHDIGNPWTHMLGWFPRRDAGDLLWLHYEDLLAHREQALRAIASWMELDVEDRLISLVLKRSQMEHMRSLANKINPSPDNYVGKLVNSFGKATQSYARTIRFGKLRRGVAGEGVASIPAEIAQDIDDNWRQRVTPVLEFADYPAMRAACGLGRDAFSCD